MWDDRVLSGAAHGTDFLSEGWISRRWWHLLHRLSLVIYLLSVTYTFPLKRATVFRTGSVSLPIQTSELFIYLYSNADEKQHILAICGEHQDQEISTRRASANTSEPSLAFPVCAYRIKSSTPILGSSGATSGLSRCVVGREMVCTATVQQRSCCAGSPSIALRVPCVHVKPPAHPLPKPELAPVWGSPATSVKSLA